MPVAALRSSSEVAGEAVIPERIQRFPERHIRLDRRADARAVSAPGSVRWRFAVICFSYFLYHFAINSLTRLYLCETV